ncbi:MAG TPA: S8 family serine peptidase [Gemmatimonadaceae bacterium]|nr:S8 family serine peptidase [Gemmatimonadaceae bacterium]
MPRHQLVADQPGIADAWTVSRGRGTVIAVVDEQVDTADHSDFVGRLLPAYGQRDADGSSRRRPHGAKVAGLAAAHGQNFSGVAPEASILPVSVPTLGAESGPADVAHALRWAAENAADVICCAWAPRDPAPADAELPAETRDALDWCLTNGRGGKGCVVVFSAGNDGNDLALNAYASHSGVIAVGACNAHGKHPSYSGWGAALWCVFTSSDPDDATGASVTYLTTAPVGSLLDGEAFYTTRFGQTSAACAAVAGICALIIAANPELTGTEVKEILRDSCEQVGAEPGVGGARQHSLEHGFGRPNAVRAVVLAQERAAVARP